MRISTFSFGIVWFILLYLPFQVLFPIEVHRYGKYAWIFQYYPIFFLPLFIKKASNLFNQLDKLEIAFCMLFFLISVNFSYVSLTWISTVWIGFTLLKGFGWKIHLFGKLLFLFVPPFSLKYVLVFGFPLRLFLTKLVGSVLVKLDPNSITYGNTLVFRGEEFIVDPACEGLKMVTAFLLLLFIFMYKTNSKLNISSISCLVISFLLLLVTNFIRIFLLVTFTIPTTSSLHYLLGIILFIAILVYPLYILGEVFIPKSQTNEITLIKEKNNSFMAFGILCILLLISLLFPSEHQENNLTYNFPTNVDEFHKDLNDLPIEIAIYSQKDMYLILKTNFDPFRKAHHPRQCWEGVGYQIIQEETIFVNQVNTIRKATLKKEDTYLRLYWWYQSIGNTVSNVTDSEFEWRKLALLKKQNFLQVNIAFYSLDKFNQEKQLFTIKKVIKYFSK
ncbi:MAG: exosortase N [Leptospiraceae bacterium]|nr:exosortase N [Leptospiraceae bacterium]